MKKLFALLLALMMVFALVACDQGDNPGGNNTDNPGTSQGGQENPGTQGGEENNGGDETPGKEWPTSALAAWNGSGKIVYTMDRESFYEDGRTQYMIYLDKGTLAEFTAYIATLKSAGFAYGNISGTAGTEPDAGYSESETFYEWGGNNGNQQYVKVILMKEISEDFTEDFDTFEYQVCIEFYTP